MIKKLNELYKALGSLFLGISEVCQQCQDDDCQGFIWLVPQEAERLYQDGVEILEINNNISFLQSFTEKDKKINIEQFKPPCPFCKKKRCTIYSKRPLVCRMYPLAFATENGIVYLILHLDCLFSKQKAADVLFRDRAVTLFKRLHPRLLKKIMETYRCVDSISKFPEGPNKYLRLVVID